MSTHQHISIREYFYSIISGQRKDVFSWLVRAALFVLSIVYQVAVGILHRLYVWGWIKSQQLPVPVISVGNITLGGSGKTPMTAWLAKRVLARSKTPVILTRGYRPRGSQSLHGEADEAQLLAKELKGVDVIANPRRYEAGLSVLKNKSVDVFLLDDGFQHWSLKRDLDILLIDTTNPFGSGYVLPAGILREPIQAIKRADVVVLTKTNQGQAAALHKQLALSLPNLLIVESVHQPCSLSNVFTQQTYDLNRVVCPVVAFCAIGSPLSFKEMLVGLGADVKEWISFMDHHEYSLDDVRMIRQRCEALGLTTVITTAKDAVKLRSFESLWQGIELLVLNIELQITKGQDELVRRMDRLLHR